MSQYTVTQHTPKQVFVAWQDPVSRRYFPTGRLSRVMSEAGVLYRFDYVRGAVDAYSQGFRPFEAFPAMNRCYEDDRLFPMFANRLIPPNRSDYAPFVRALGLDPDRADPLDILARSGGRRATDGLEMFSRPVPLGKGQSCVACFAVHGVRHMPRSAADRILSLGNGDKLYLLHDRQNPVDSHALLLRTVDYVNVGFVPRYLVPDTWELMQGTDPQDVEFSVDRVNPPPVAVQQRLMCRMHCPGEASFHDPLLRPLVELSGEEAQVPSTPVLSLPD